MKRLTDRSFGLGMAVIFLGFGAFFWFVHGQANSWLLAISVFFLFTALAVPILLLPLNRIWTLVTHALSRGLNFVLLSILFFVVLAPVSVILRAIGYDKLVLKRKGDETTFFRGVGRSASAETMRDMF